MGLAGVTQWIECWPVKQRVTGLIPGQGTCITKLKNKLMFLSLSFSLKSISKKIFKVFSG